MNHMETYKKLISGGVGEIEEKRSRFIGEIRAVASEAEAKSFIEATRKKYYDARHHCYAYLVPDEDPARLIQRSSDDGEPSGTAGRPILSVLLGSELTGVCIVVTRYFGGTLLGTGGLIRAYTAAAKAALEAAVIEDIVKTRRETFVIDYSELDKLKYKLKEQNAVIVDTQYTDKVTLTADIPI